MTAWSPGIPPAAICPPGERILALVLNLLTDRQPLYQVGDAFQLTDVPLLLGPGVAAEDLTDDALGRALDKLAAAGPAAVFSAVAARADAVETIDRGGMHVDSTSRALYGDYPTADGTHGVTPRHGHSKDHRDDLTQLLFPCVVNREGVPRMGPGEDGNRSDKRLNRQQIDRLGQALSPEALQDLVYIAASALVTGPNLDALAAIPLTWLSRLPDTFGVAATAKAAAWAADAWIPLGRGAQTPRAATYAASEQTGTLGDRSYRLVVYRSSRRDRRQAKTRDRDLVQARVAAEQAAAALSAQDFACAADAEAAATTFAATAPRWWPCPFTVTPATLTAKRTRPGRPRRDDPAPTHTVYRVTVTWGPRDDAAVRTELARRRTFVLITTLSADQYDAAALLREYKGQTSVEQRFHFLKDPALVDAVFLQQPERIQALGYVMLLALLLFSCLERRVWQAPEPFPTAYRGRVVRPPGPLILHHCRRIPVMWRDAPHRYLAIPAAHRPAVRVLLEALALTETIYTYGGSQAPPVLGGVRLGTGSRQGRVGPV